MLKLIIQRRSIASYYELFPKTFPQGKPQWRIEQSKLRKEYRQLQAQHHPDMISATPRQENGNNQRDRSSLLNKAYHTLKDPLLRSQHILKTLNDLDLNKEEQAQTIMQSDPSLLMQVLDVHEQLEEVQTEEDVHSIESDNKKRISDIEDELGECFEVKDFDRASKLTVELKYWVNLAKAMKEWEPGKLVTLRH